LFNYEKIPANPLYLIYWCLSPFIGWLWLNKLSEKLRERLFLLGRLFWPRFFIFVQRLFVYGLFLKFFQFVRERFFRLIIGRLEFFFERLFF